MVSKKSAVTLALEQRWFWNNKKQCFLTSKYMLIVKKNCCARHIFLGHHWGILVSKYFPKRTIFQSWKSTIKSWVSSWCAYQDDPFHPQQWESTFRTTFIGLTCAHHNQNNSCLQVSCLPTGSRSLILPIRDDIHKIKMCRDVRIQITHSIPNNENLLLEPPSMVSHVPTTIRTTVCCRFLASQQVPDH